MNQLNQNPFFRGRSVADHLDELVEADFVLNEPFKGPVLPDGTVDLEGSASALQARIDGAARLLLIFDLLQADVAWTAQLPDTFQAAGRDLDLQLQMAMVASVDRPLAHIWISNAGGLSESCKGPRPEMMALARDSLRLYGGALRAAAASGDLSNANGVRLDISRARLPISLAVLGAGALTREQSMARAGIKAYKLYEPLAED